MWEIRDNLCRQTVGRFRGFLYLTGFLQNGRNHTALEVPTGVVVLLRIVRRNRRPDLGLQVLIVAGHGAQGHPIQDEALLQPQRILAQAHHPDHRPPRTPLAGVGGPRQRAPPRIVTWSQDRTPATQTLLSHPTPWALRAAGEVACLAQRDEQEAAMQETEGKRDY